MESLKLRENFYNSISPIKMKYNQKVIVYIYYCVYIYIYKQNNCICIHAHIYIHNINVHIYIKHNQLTKVSGMLAEGTCSSKGKPAPSII